MARILLFLAAIMVSAHLMAGPDKPNVYISYCTFYSPQDGPFLETYMAFSGKSVNFVLNEKGMLQARLEILILLKQNDSIKAFKKYNLFSPEISDTSQTAMLFHDQQRISIPNGDYFMEITIRDANGGGQPFIISEPISVMYSSSEIQLSGIELLQSAVKTEQPGPSSKAGYDLLPLPLNVYPPSEDHLRFYAEMYNMQRVLGDTGKYLLRISVEELQTSRKIPGLLFQKRMDAKNVEAVLHEFDITGLPTGEYYLVMEIKDRSNEQLAVNKVFFERWNDQEQTLTLVDDEYVKNSFVAQITNADTLAEYIRSLRPISTASEKDYVDENLKTADLMTMQRFFLNFWIQRNETNPESSWISYAIEVTKVNANFGTMIRKGYETDRGRVYLQYGPPNTITSVPSEPSAYPYEIWHYYKLSNQANRKFVFCDFDMVTNDYELVHSDAIGEPYDGNWTLRVNKSKAGEGTRDNQQYNFGWGSRVNDYYNTPR